MKGSQSSLFNILHYKVGNHYGDGRSHGRAMDLLIHLLSELQKGCIEAQS